MPHPFLSLKDPTHLPAALASPVVAIGNFDGVHRGHSYVMGKARDEARRLKRPAAVLTFDPHPRAFLRPDLPQFELTPIDVQADLIAALGMDGLIVLSFNAAFASLSAEEFIRDILVGKLGISGAVVGWDFHFGKGRSGSPASLTAAGKAHGFEVTVLDPLASGEAPISSTRIRQALTAGDLATANSLLGYEWFVRGPVIHGEKRGRDLGYPTANMALAPGCGLRHGIYAVRARVDGVSHAAVASFGRRPTFDNGAPLLETHLFDFREDLYGKTIDIAFVRFLREELAFTSLDGLIAQMDRDSAEARALLAAPKI